MCASSSDRCYTLCTGESVAFVRFHDAYGVLITDAEQWGMRRSRIDSAPNKLEGHKP